MAKTDNDRLRIVEERFRLFMENVREYAVFMLDTEGRVVDWNLGAEKVLGYGDDIVGQPFSIFFPPADRQSGAPERELQIAAETGRASDDRWHIRKDGTYFWAMGVTTAMRDEQGVLKGFTKVLRDSTERKHFEEELHKRNQALLEADRRKDEFLAVLAHELRNPMAPVFNGLAVLQQQNLPDEMRQQTHQLIDRQMRHLARLVDDLLDVARVSTGKIPLHRQRIDLRVIVENAVQACQTAIDAKRHRLSQSLGTDPIWLEADHTRLEQVIVNLLTNAAKYSAEGSEIVITASQESDEAVVRVRDTGIGIEPALLPHVFDLFTQADRSLDRANGGLGIGLTLVRKLVELHGGTVEAHSEGLAKGSEFVVRLPVTEAAEVATPAPTTEDVSPLRLLVVDDNQDAADSLSTLLTLSGHEVKTVYDADSALTAVQCQSLDVILMDIGLPGINGYELAQRFRAMPGVKDVILIAITGYAPEERSRRAGFNHHLLKPVDPDTLQRLLAVIGQRKQG